MLNTKTKWRLVILRLAACLAIALFSFDMTSSLFITEDIQVEVLDIDSEGEEFEIDEEIDFFASTIDLPFLELTEVGTSLKFPNSQSLYDAHQESLPSPPPDCI